MLKNLNSNNVVNNDSGILNNKPDLSSTTLSKKSQATPADDTRVYVKATSAQIAKVYANATPVEFVSDAVEQADLVITTAYKQVFGNAHLMESERFVEAESQLRNGQITVMEFVRLLAKSERYRALVFEKHSNLRAIELNFKHLLGRAPESYAEISEHIARLVNEGCDAEIDSYIDSDEYFEAFGTDIVPYYRGYQTQTGRKLVGYTHSIQIINGASSSDKSTSVSSYKKLDEDLLNSDAFTALLDKVDISETIQKLSQSPRAPQSGVSKYCPKTACPSANIYEPEQIIRRALNLHFPSQQLQPPIALNTTSPTPDPTDPVEIIRKVLKIRT
ncbi:phycobilisome linker polypeptide [Leptolyngbyaceae cyanobacterium CCMR0082]|uniref:Phycobilisome linker polypeptide n=1 Tax=Adonisia turfae CCMR0082 TaxID=2304604 RepID=A0A6M0S877_9CYAN|nr:phycobilisome rod-core linker polypeptide [Adonisia turfae]NEZ64022.1 phycobilisome linker polypeptide [Adonisia turfae CCMR0082]